MHCEVACAWNKYWQRDDPQQIEEWEGCVPFCTGVADCPTMTFEEFDPIRWRHVVKTIPNKSSRGACSFSKRELLHMPQNLLAVLFSMYAAFESGVTWPTRWAVARVVCLKKGTTAKDPTDLRPITILSRIYRVWSAYRSSQILQHISKLVPPAIAGTCGKTSADALVGLTTMTIDQRRSANETTYGGVLDLKKCYNTIPRLPMVLILRAIGVPEPYIRGLHMMFVSMRRSIQLGQSMGPLLASTTGIAEGCSFSVACMCALSFIAAKALDCIQNVTPIFFADNWSVISQTIEALQQALRKLEQLADSFKMTFSSSKSWVWTSASRIPSRLQKLTIQNETIPVQSNATDLGCDVTYRGRIRKQENCKRIDKTKRVCKIIKGKRLPMKFKRTATKLAAQGACMYGRELGFTSSRQWHQIRSNTAAALNQNSGGSSPWLALCCIDVFLDPQCRFLVKLIKFWRRTLSLFPEFKEWFLWRVAQDALPKLSPCWVFQQSFLDVGWKCHAHGWIHGPHSFRFNWLNDSISHIKRFIQQAWSTLVTDKVSHRKFLDIGQFDVGWHNSHFKTLNDRQQGLILTYHAGKHFTGDFLCKFVADNHGKCVVCNGDDSREHQLLHCEKMQDIRDEYPGAVEWISNASQATKHFALCPWDASMLIRRLQHCD